MVLVIGDCTVRSLAAKALDAASLYLSINEGELARLWITHGHHPLLSRPTAYGDASFRFAYRYHPEPPSWHYATRQPSITDIFNAALDNWRPVADLNALVILFGGTGWAKESTIMELHDFFVSGCNASQPSCWWKSRGLPTPKIIIKGHTTQCFDLSQDSCKEEIQSQLKLRALVQSLGFIWLDVFNVTRYTAFLGGDGLHYDFTDSARASGFRARGPITHLITNLFLDELCGPLPFPDDLNTSITR